jgi:site-specific DNA-methyltransferase (adenine-specific)
MSEREVSREPMEAYISPTDDEERVEALPQQEEFWRPPVRFGTIPVEKEPLGWDKRKGFYKLFPRVSLPFQIVERVSFGHPDLPANRLIWGDNLHVMRQLPSESIDLIYIDPPFFSGRQYNIIFGDQNEVRSFTDIWEGGMPGYLIWLNARLYEMKRLLKKTGSIMIHLDEHAVHYVKVEMDKVFGYSSFVNEIIWHYTGGGRSKRYFSNKHDTILWYAKDGRNGRFFFDVDAVRVPYKETSGYAKGGIVSAKGKRYLPHPEGTPVDDVWDIPIVNPLSKERIGYPTQKPEALLERIIKSACPPDGIVADFFCGGGTTPAVAQRLGRRWIACDQSRVAVAVTADRLIRGAQQLQMDLAIPDFTVEYWGVYEARRLTQMPEGEFRPFILRCFGATPNTDPNEPHIHGYKGSVPVWVCPPDARYEVRHTDVVAFANAVRHSIRYQQSDLRDGVMLGWAFTPQAREAAEQLRQRAGVDVNFIRLELIRIDSPRFREHVAKLSTNHADYENFLTFIQPPRVEVGYERVASLTYRFDVSDTVVVNPGAKIINVQWDFDYDGRQFRSTQGYALSKASEPVVYKFPRAGKFTIACKVQDDKGGEGMWVGEVEVS